ncbi:hypothetical protein HaLaN_08995 [Haematococcus lacustris]|uniref:Uncharacterized protein n=1 Tax=Haematococcus lacustris TaxID=44745 RepID=A0A699Z2E2_HAELA|nr:hypothetical protein HaLaN_08995 [Haematococcus lacustris]
MSHCLHNADVTWAVRTRHALYRLPPCIPASCEIAVVKATDSEPNAHFSSAFWCVCLQLAIAATCALGRVFAPFPGGPRHSCRNRFLQLRSGMAAWETGMSVYTGWSCRPSGSAT